MAGYSMFWRGVITMMLMCMPLMVTAQRDVMLTRAQLDSLVNPTISTQAPDVLEVDAQHKNLGKIGAEDMINVSYTLRNTASYPVTITELRSSCSCLKVTSKPTTIEPNGTIRIEAQFNPTGRSGEFRQNIHLYTDLDSSYPTKRLSIEGIVENNDAWSYLPEYMGLLRLSRKEVIINSQGSERIAIANSGSKPLRLSAHSTLPGLQLRTEPEVLDPGTEGDMVISYIGELATTLSTMLVVEGVDAVAPQRVIKVTIKR